MLMSVSGTAIISFNAWNSTITRIAKRIGMIPMIVPAGASRQYLMQRRYSFELD
jgi:hypothetical protein